jgi:hypothetical protein
MTCAELERVLPEIVDGVRTAEQEAHLDSCRECASVIADLNLISQRARTFQASEEPHPRVWHGISATLTGWESEIEQISEQARLLQGSEEPSPRVWNSIQATLEQWQSEMNDVSEQAGFLQASDDPSPRVWNSIEIALRQEGLIRQPHRDSLVASGTVRRWKWAWLAPVAAALLVVGVTVYERGDAPVSIHQMALAKLPVTSASLNSADMNDDQQMLEAVSLRTPAMRSVYENNLQNVNSYIHDAEQSVKDDPNDEEAQESLVNAYEQKSMLYEMALDRSLP